MIPNTIRHKASIIFLSSLFGVLIGLFVVSQHNLIFSPLGASLLFSLFFLVTFAHIAKHDYIFGFFYAFLFIYTIFTQIAYVVYPETLAAISTDQYYGLDIYYRYILFVSLSFLAIYFVFIFIHRKNVDTHLFSIIKSKRPALTNHFVFLSIIVVHNIIMIYFLASSYEALSYYTQGTLKANKIFFYGFYFYEITLLVLYVKLTKFSNIIEKHLYSILFLMSGAIFLAISVRSGQRIEMISFFLGFTTYIFLSSSTTFRDKTKTILKLSPILISILIFANIVRTLRGSFISMSDFVHAFLSSPIEYLSIFFNPKAIIMQDYVVPSLTLLTSMNYHIVFPLEVIKSNFFNSFVLFGYPTLGSTLSRIIDPFGGIGYGYYFLTEGYNFMGWYGIIYNALVFVIGLALWKKISSSDNKVFSNYMTAIIAMQVFGIVRGQGSFFIKGVYLSFIPAIILFSLASGLKIKRNIKFRFK